MRSLRDESVRAAGRGLRAAPARSPSVPADPGRRGLTLFEMILVLAIAIVLASLAYPSLEEMYVHMKVAAAADKVRAAWSTARAQSISEGRPYRFAVVPNMGNYRVAPDSPDYWSADSPDFGNPELTGFVIDDVLPQGIRFSVGGGTPADDFGQATSLPAGQVDPSLWASPVIFLPDGTTREDVELIFQARGTRPLLMRLRALTGVVTTRPIDAGALVP